VSAGSLTIRVIVAYREIPINACGIYSYGETEDYQITIINPTNADLSLRMTTTSRITAVNQPISYSVTLQNRGPGNATGISWQNTLPPNLIFASGGPGVINSGTTVGGSGIALANGTSATFIYQLMPTQAGTFSNAAQIMTSSQTDPNSVPGSGTGDGQDDTDIVTIRTSGTSSSFFASPNPNQTPLPPLVANQPVPDLTKADLSVQIKVSNRTPKVGQPVTFTAIISNAGGATANSIVVRDTVRGLTLSGLPSSISVVSTGSNYSVIESTIDSLPAGATAQVIFTAVPVNTGNLLNIAQIWAVVTSDPDSIPGSVTPSGNNLNGEDDIAAIDLRVVP
jgi:uncharacterized repeat protein (TIGR01451 family)